MCERGCFDKKKYQPNWVIHPLVLATIIEEINKNDMPHPFTVSCSQKTTTTTSNCPKVISLTGKSFLKFEILYPFPLVLLDFIIFVNLIPPLHTHFRFFRCIQLICGQVGFFLLGGISNTTLVCKIEKSKRSWNFRYLKNFETDLDGFELDWGVGDKVDKNATGR